MQRTRPHDRAPRPVFWAGLTALTCGAVLCVIGWYGISGERFAERQLPYLASCTVPGAALIIAGAVLVARGDARTWPPRAEEPYDPAGDEDPADLPAPPSAEGPPLRVPGGTLLHRPDCPLVTGKPGARPAGDASGLLPCPVCEPPGATPSAPAVEA
ncbi:hypothetical protein ABCR94_21630 [Streptomyces sp. 21So2-11]|uniref:hypothetical protein n=1 Tax=Streptomyces sp. 21So2-11 TaxID=3144408 RepID=UPI00321955AC